jgi:hypothetical protein
MGGQRVTPAEELAQAIYGWRDNSPRAQQRRALARDRLRRLRVERKERERLEEQRRELIRLHEERERERELANLPKLTRVEQRQADLIADVAMLKNTDTPDSIAKRVGYTSTASLAKQLHRLGRHDLAAPFDAARRDPYERTA